jgi:hypothetical protein
MRQRVFESYLMLRPRQRLSGPKGGAEAQIVSTEFEKAVRRRQGPLKDVQTK